MFEQYYQSVKFLESLSNIPQPDYMHSRHKDGAFFIKRMNALVKTAGIDLNKFKFIHIAGTSGKGTTTAMVHNILYAAGKSVGSYYSPHPTTMIERIRVNDKYASVDDFVRAAKKIFQAAEKTYLSGRFGRPSYFEICTAIAFDIFDKKKCEYAVLETGCGGQFDATNIIRRPLVTAITSIGYDHTEILGKTLTAIGRAKAGIIKPGSVFLTTEKRARLVNFFKKTCEKRRAKFTEINDVLDIKDIKDIEDILKVGGLNSNAMLGNAIGKVLGISNQHIAKGIKNTGLPCRFEMMQNNPRVIVDGAHNPDKIKFSLERLSEINYRNLYLIFTLKVDKDADKIITQFKGRRLKEVYVTRHLVESVACAPLKNLYNSFLSAFKKERVRVKIMFDPYNALNEALKKAGREDIILITGSFYLAGELRKYWVSEEKILRDNP